MNWKIAFFSFLFKGQSSQANPFEMGESGLHRYKGCIDIRAQKIYESMWSGRQMQIKQARLNHALPVTERDVNVLVFVCQVFWDPVEHGTNIR